MLVGESECGCHAHFVQREIGETSSFPKPRLVSVYGEYRNSARGDLLFFVLIWKPC